MINPEQITKVDRTQDEKQAFLIFTVAVAGKTAKTVAPKVNEFVAELVKLKKSVFRRMEAHTILDVTRLMFELGNESELLGRLMDVKMGKYTTLMSMFAYLAANDVNLDTASPAELERIPGVGQKSSRFFILHTRSNPEPMAALDTHILKFLNANGVDAPLATPSSPTLYARLEKEFINLYERYVRDDFKGTIADFDLRIWIYYSQKMGKNVEDSNVMRYKHLKDFIHSEDFKAEALVGGIARG